MSPASTPGSAVGRPLERLDGRAKVTGTARYAAEFRHDRMAYAVLVQSTIAKGRVASIDAAAARRSPGAIAVLTHENAPKLRMPAPQPGNPSSQNGSLGEKRLPLSDPEIHFVGENVAIVVAESLEQARHAASLVRIRYQEERPVLDYLEARSSGTRPEKALGNRPAQHRRGDVDAALAAADVVKVEGTYGIPVETNNPMEPSATVARWEGDRLTVEDSTQYVVGTRQVLAAAFGVPIGNVRVICPYTGGGFGCKGHQWPHTLAAALAARVVRRPVHLELTRPQMFTSVGHRPPTLHRVALAAGRDGRLTAIRHETVNATSPVTEFVAPCGLVTSAVLYACENVDAPSTVVKVNVGAPTPMRAPAECPGSFPIECAMDELAGELAIDPIDLRLRNYAEKDPVNGKPWSSKHLNECYAIGAQKFGWGRRSAKPGSMREGGRLVGWGMASAIYPGHRRASSAKVRLTPDGRALVTAATHELGTGSYTIFTQVAADALHLPVDRVTFQLGDTELPPAPLSAGSCSAASVSEAILRAADAARTKLAAAASREPESLESLDGAGRAELIRRAGLPAIEGEGSIEAEDEKMKAHSIHSFGAQFCEVRIDPALPRVEVTRFVSVHDVGRVLNPRTTRSQIIGGVVFGIGMALTEHTVYDSRTGRPVNDNLADYLVPVNADVGEIEVELLDHPDPVINTLGCRGAGEIGIVGVGAAIANAVFHATGRRIRELPITPDKLL
jgi:xanthine dehydrogenase YagR molybdenum-binding subunit